MVAIDGSEYLDMGVVSDGACDSCGNMFTKGLALASPSGEPLAAFCQWCIANGLQAVTGYGVLNQLLSWETLRNSRRVTPWRGWHKISLPDLVPSDEPPNEPT